MQSAHAVPGRMRGGTGVLADRLFASQAQCVVTRVGQAAPQLCNLLA